MVSPGRSESKTRRSIEKDYPKTSASDSAIVPERGTNELLRLILRYSSNDRDILIGGQVLSIERLNV